MVENAESKKERLLSRIDRSKRLDDSGKETARQHVLSLDDTGLSKLYMMDDDTCEIALTMIVLSATLPVGLEKPQPNLFDSYFKQRIEIEHKSDGGMLASPSRRR